jgi:hypothetical protein
MSTKASSSVVNDIGSVVSLIDRMAESAPGNSSRAAAGEDLVAMTKCLLGAKNLMSQDGIAATRRSVSINVAKEISKAAREHGAEPVGVFVEEDAKELEHACDAVCIAFVQGPHSQFILLRG